VNTYGSQGYVLGAWNNGTTDQSSLPASASFTLPRGARYCWNCSTTDGRALQDPANTSAPRHAATWYDGTRVHARLTFTSPYSGTVRVYALDWDNVGRRQRVTFNAGGADQVVDITTPFNSGAWMTFPVTNATTVNITIDRTAGPNAVLSGIFLGNAGPPFTPPPPPPGAYTSSPQGNWVNAYGSEGYVLGAWNNGTTDQSSLPASASFTLPRGARYCWNCSTNDQRALQDPNTSAPRHAATWYDGTRVHARLTFTTPYSGNVRVYALDWDNVGRRQRVTFNAGGADQVVDITTAFNNGAWMTFPVTNATTVNITVDRTAGPNAVLSGIFLGNAGPPFTPPPPPPPAYTSSPQGNWVNAYGSEGYVLGAWNNGTSDLVSLPAGASFTLNPSFGARYCWNCSNNDQRALQDPNGGTRHAATLYHGTQLRATLTFSTPYSGNVRLYALDWDNMGRRQRVTFNAGAGNQVVDITTAFNNGAWMTFEVDNATTVNITVDRTAGPNAVLSGIFLGDGGPPLPP
jgi:hypothetical protein